MKLNVILVVIKLNVHSLSVKGFNQMIVSFTIVIEKTAIIIK
jgi:hypothetical protein